jgi:hypothetical protein
MMAYLLLFAYFTLKDLVLQETCDLWRCLSQHASLVGQYSALCCPSTEYLFKMTGEEIDVYEEIAKVQVQKQQKKAQKLTAYSEFIYH